MFEKVQICCRKAISERVEKVLELNEGKLSCPKNEWRPRCTTQHHECVPAILCQDRRVRVIDYRSMKGAAALAASISICARWPSCLTCTAYHASSSRMAPRLVQRKKRRVKTCVEGAYAMWWPMASTRGRHCGRMRRLKTSRGGTRRRRS